MPRVSWTPFSNMPRPSDCRKCKRRFEQDGLLQRELEHLAVKYGPSAAEDELNERYAEFHIAEHNWRGK